MVVFVICKASAVILEGGRSLAAFSNQDCELDEDFRPKCTSPQIGRAAFIGLFAERFRGQKDRGSHKYRGKELLIDDILVHTTDLSMLKRANGSYSIGLEGQFFKGSDQ